MLDRFFYAVMLWASKIQSTHRSRAKRSQTHRSRAKRSSPAGCGRSMEIDYSRRGVLATLLI